MRNLIKVKDEKGLARDPYSKAILNIDDTARQTYKKKQEAFRKMMLTGETVSDLNEKINSMETEIMEIKSLLIDFLHKKL